MPETGGQTKEILINGEPTLVIAKVVILQLLNALAPSPDFTFNLGAGALSTIRLGAWNTWVPAFTGFSANPTVGFARFQTIGKLCLATCTLTAGGTSNAAGYTMTLPVAALNNVFGVCTFVAQDNGVTLATPGRADTTAASNILSIFKDMTGVAGWTASGTKSAASITALYETA